ncbi:MAG: carboxypeptidase regulatory-like domain-containing protein [Kofleriaceae bacterium]|nr:MAG: carboxypeptidase regulatory-like domain-containing protein [Kofleriaceae bacterium]MBZ0232972.1 carboxypeptidase-like regulatory domain-containing protein [Kofleriaceae bacterium]
MRRACLLLFLALLGSCCTLELRWGLSIGVTGSDTGQPIPAMVVIRDGDYVEQLMTVGDRHVGAGERPGTYRIDIFADGYATRTLTDIEVDEEGCHVEPRVIDVALSPL